MPTQRRYTPEEVAAIFEDAAEAQTTSGRHAYAGGLTLDEIQAIGAEEGFDPAFVAQAAARLDAPPAPVSRALGVPTSVSHSVLLPAPLTDAAWERLVAAFRHTFHARGKDRRDGSLRSWSNGNLRITTEPAEGGGERLRFRSRNQRYQGGLTGGALVAGAGLVLALIALLLGSSGPHLPAFGFQILLGLVIAGVAALNVRPWRAERRTQFEALGAQAIALVTAEAGRARTPTLESAEPTGTGLSLDDLPAPSSEPGAQSTRRVRG